MKSPETRGRVNEEGGNEAMRQLACDILVASSQPSGCLAFRIGLGGLVVGDVHLVPLEVKLVAGDLRTAQTCGIFQGLREEIPTSCFTLVHLFG